MALKNDSGFSLPEITIAMAILLIVGTMINKHFVVSSKASQEIGARGASHDVLMQTLQKLRKSMSIRASKVPVTSLATSLSFSIPLTSTSAVDYQLNISTKCRPLPAGASLDVSRVKSGLACLQKLNCPNGVPYIEWRYSGHPQLTLEVQPQAAVFQRELAKVFGSPGYGLCFEQTLDNLTIIGLQMNLRTEASNRIAIVTSETLVVPLNKRNNIELVP